MKVISIWTLRLVNIVYMYSPGGVLEVFMTGGGGGGGSDGASYCKPKKIHKPEILDPKKYLASKFPNQKNTRLKYLNTDLFT